ncbi:MAG: MFS transporter [Desulfobacterales bacterium]
MTTSPCPPDRAEEALARRTALGVAAAGSFLTPFMLSAVHVALPAIGRSLSADAVQLGWVATSIVAAAAAALVPAGRLADLHGRKRLFRLGMMVLAAATLLAGLAPTIGFLIACRVLQGLGIAFVFATGIALVTAVYPREERGRVLGVTVAAVYAGLSLGPLVGGLLTAGLSWRAIFLLPPPLCVLLAWLTGRNLKGEWAPACGGRLDGKGTVLYAASVTALLSGLAELLEASGMLLFAAGLAGLYAFGRRQLRHAEPLFEMHLLLENRVFAFSCLAALIHYAATYGVTFLMSLCLQLVQGLSPREAGLVLTAQPVFMALFSPFAGRLSDRLEPRIPASAGMAVTALALGGLMRVAASENLLPVFAVLALLGFGFALFSSPNMNAILSAVPPRLYGVASGSVATMRLLGQGVSLGIVTLLFAAGVGREPLGDGSRAAFLSSLNGALAVFLVLCLAGAAISLLRGNLRGEGRGAAS